MAIGLLCMVTVVGLWSVTPTLIKIALRYIDPFSLAFVRLFLGLIVLFFYQKARNRRWIPRFSKEPWLLIGGLGITLNYVFFKLSLNYTTAGFGVLISQVQVVGLAALAAIVLKERISWIKISGMIVVIIGVMLIFFIRVYVTETVRRQYALGNIFMILGGLGWSVYALGNKAVNKRLANSEYLIPVFMLGVVTTGVLAAIQFQSRSPLDAEGIVAISVLGLFVTGFGFLFTSEALRRLSAALAGITTSITPLFSLVIAHLVLSEMLSPWLFVSAILIVGGVVIIAISEWRNRL